MKKAGAMLFPNPRQSLIEKLFHVGIKGDALVLGIPSGDVYGLLGLKLCHGHLVVIAVLGGKFAPGIDVAEMALLAFGDVEGVILRRGGQEIVHLDVQSDVGGDVWGESFQHLPSRLPVCPTVDGQRDEGVGIGDVDGSHLW